jgi:hypothetical protein
LPAAHETTEITTIMTTTAMMIKKTKMMTTTMTMIWSPPNKALPELDSPFLRSSQSQLGKKKALTYA